MDDKQLALYIGDRIKTFRLKNRLTQKELADKVGMGHTTIANYEKGFRTPKKNTVFALANALGISIDELFPPLNYTPLPSTPEVEYIPSTLDKITTTSAKLDHKRQLVVLSTAEDELKEQIKGHEKKHNVISIFDKQVEYDYYDQPASAGSGQYLSDVEVQKIELPVEIDADFVIQVDGVSMEPDYLDDDYVFVKLSYNLSNGDIGVFYYNGNAYIKQLRIDGNKAYLHSLNPDYKDMPITEDTDFRMIGKVVDVYRDI